MNTLHFILSSNGRGGILTEAFSVSVFGKLIIVPPGFKTDFASVPQFLWGIIPPWGKYSRAAVVHDYLYRNGFETRKKSDEIFLKMMEMRGVPFWKRRAMYYGVRWFGKSSYKDDKCKRR